MLAEPYHWTLWTYFAVLDAERLEAFGRTNEQFEQALRMSLSHHAPRELATLHERYIARHTTPTAGLAETVAEARGLERQMRRGKVQVKRVR